MAVDVSDRTVALKIAPEVEDKLIYVDGLGWHAFDGMRWAAVSNVEAKEVVALYCQSIRLALTRPGMETADKARLATLKTNAKVKSVLDMLKGLVRHDASDLDTWHELLNVQNGVVNLRSRELLPHDPKLYITKVAQASYRPGFTHSDWTKVQEAFASEAVGHYVQLRMGQAATGYSPTDDVMPIFIGLGSNAKTSVIDSCEKTLGVGEYVAHVPDKLLISSANDHSTSMTTLMGARLAVLEELPEGHFLPIKRLKTIVGTNVITARKIAKDDVSWVPTHSLMVTTNYQPLVAETDWGTWRRLALIRFPWTFLEEPRPLVEASDRRSDPGIKHRLKYNVDNVWDAVLNWIIDGAYEVLNTPGMAMPMPQEVEEDTQAWRGSSAVLSAYMDQSIEFDPDGIVLQDDLLADVNGFLRRQGKSAWSVDTLNRRLKELEDNRITKARVNNPKRLSQPYWASASFTTTGKVQVLYGIRFRSDLVIAV